MPYMTRCPPCEGLPFSTEKALDDSIKAAYEMGYMNGKSTAVFQPDGSVTRQQLWMILARLSGSNPSDMAEARAWAMSNGISDGTNPGDPVTRQQMVTILYRYASLKGNDVSDKADLSAYFASTVRLFRFSGLPVRFKRSEIIGEAAKLESQYFRCPGLQQPEPLQAGIHPI